MKKTTYFDEETESEAAVQHEINTLLKDCLSIQVQLRQRNRKNPNGQQMTAPEWHEWRLKAIWALDQKMKRYRQLKSSQTVQKKSNQAARHQEWATRTLEALFIGSEMDCEQERSEVYLRCLERLLLELVGSKVYATWARDPEKIYSKWLPDAFQAKAKGD